MEYFNGDFGPTLPQGLAHLIVDDRLSLPRRVRVLF